METLRKTVLKKLIASPAVIIGSGLTINGKAATEDGKKMLNTTNFQDTPLFSPFTRFGNLVFISGRGARLDGDIRVHTDNVLKIIEAELINAGSSMNKVLKVTAFLDNMDDYAGMNEVFKGRFGENPPALTTVAAHDGLPPADNLIQMDCIAYI